MGDLIRRKAALAAIESYKIEHCPEYMQNWASKIKRAILDDIVDDAKALPAVEAEPKWIPVTERLPEEPLQTVFVTNGSFVCVGVYSVVYEEFGVMCGRGQGKRFGVTHWMPLPDPPKEEEECFTKK